MIKVAFYFDNNRMKDIDCSQISQGNPGLGGTQYMFWYISSNLSLSYKDLDVVLYANEISKMPSFLKCTLAESLLEAAHLALKDKVDILIVRGPYIQDEFYDFISSTNIKVITWCHNYERYPEIRRIAKCRNIIRNICVGKEQLDRLIDNPLYLKSDYIYNTIQMDLYHNANRTDYINKSVCFMGSIVPEKGFHELANIWPQIESLVPDAQLFVIGSGDYYKKNKKMGKYGIAYQDYEKQFIDSLLDSNKNIKANVHFMGAMGGKEKIDFLKKMYIAVPKSTLTRETFCICAIEFEACGVPVVSGKRYSLVEVVSDGITGSLFSNRREFVSQIVELLNNPVKRAVYSDNCYDFVSSKFNEKDVLNKWHQTICEVYEGKIIIHDPITENLYNNKKMLRIINSNIRKVVPIIPSIAWWEDLPHIIKKCILGVKKK